MLSDIEAYIRQKNAVATAALNSLFLDYGPDLTGLLEVLRPHLEHVETGAPGPPWWKQGEHDIALLKGFSKHGVGVHYAKIFRDPRLFGFGPRETKINKQVRTRSLQERDLD